MHITVKEVLDILKSLGTVKVYPRTLQEIREEIVRALAEICALSIATGRSWKVANIVFIFKKGCKKKP